MATSTARDAEDFARLLFRSVERLGERGEWVPARQAFAETVAEHPEHPYALYLKAKPSRRTGLATVAERLRSAEFPTIERRRASSPRNAPVFYRIVRAPAELELQLPPQVAPDHPLVKKHRAASAAGDQPVSVRRTRMTEPGPKSPWRRRLLIRPLIEIHVPSGLEAASQSLRHWWDRLRVAVSEVAASARRS